MNYERNDNGLKKAAKEQCNFKLSPNFTYRTMQKVEETAHLHEKKTEQNILFATVIASIFLVGCCITGLVIYFGESIKEAFTTTIMDRLEIVQIPFFYILLLIAIPLFLLFDKWMRKQYFKHYS